MNARIRQDHTAPEHEEAIRWVDDLTLRMKLQLLGEEHEPITIEQLHDNAIVIEPVVMKRKRLVFY